MASELALVLVAGAALLAINSWPASLVLCTVVAILQDPLRKLAPGQPVYFVVLVGVVFAAGWIGAYGARVELRPRGIYGWQRQVGAPFTCLMCVVIAQAVLSLSRFGSVAMTGIGLLAYCSGIPAIILAYQYAIRFGIPGISRWMWTHVALASVALVGVYLEYVGVGWQTLGQVGEGLIIYDVNRALKAYSGFFRAAEIAAWHSSAIACWIVMLLFGRRRSLPGLIGASGLVLSSIAIGLLTGRRKLLVQLIIFVCAYLGLFAIFQRNSRKLAGVVGVAGLVAYLLFMGFADPRPAERVYDSHDLSVADDEMYTAYALRTRSVLEDVGGRVSEFGLQYAFNAYAQWGFFGAGLGAGSQGTQHFGGDEMLNRGASEAGLGKIMLELGVPGMVAVAWLGYAMVGYVSQTLSYLATTSAPHARVGFGLVAFLVANAATFLISTQAYADVFILLCLGWSTGFLLALPVLASREGHSRLASAGFVSRGSAGRR